MVYLIYCPLKPDRTGYWGGSYYTNGKVFNSEAGWANRWVAPNEAVPFLTIEDAALMKMEYYDGVEIQKCPIVPFREALERCYGKEDGSSES